MTYVILKSCPRIVQDIDDATLQVLGQESYKVVDKATHDQYIAKKEAESQLIAVKQQQAIARQSAISAVGEKLKGLGFTDSEVKILGV